MQSDKDLEGHWEMQRAMMLEVQLISRGISDTATLEAMGAVPRESFVPEDVRHLAYEDGPLPIGEGQTISQPYIVALMVQAAQVQPSDKVLDIGTGSGYAAAVLSSLASCVYTIERIASLSTRAQALYSELTYRNIECKLGDGSLGWAEKGPFDVIVVAAGAPEVPKSLLRQLSDGGRLLIPVGDAHGQHLLRLTKRGDEIDEETLEYVRFVPLIGAEGWHS